MSRRRSILFPPEPPVAIVCKICGVIRKYSDAMALALLHAAKPEEVRLNILFDDRVAEATRQHHPDGA